MLKVTIKFSGRTLHAIGSNWVITKIILMDPRKGLIYAGMNPDQLRDHPDFLQLYADHESVNHPEVLKVEEA